MPKLSTLQIVFLAYNAAAGGLLGAWSALSPTLERLGLPVYAWLAAAMLAFEVVAGLTLRVHPSTAISMGTRLAAIAVSFATCAIALAMLKPA